jgi:hypothetical protein
MDSILQFFFTTAVSVWHQIRANNSNWQLFGTQQYLVPGMALIGQFAPAVVLVYLLALPAAANITLVTLVMFVIPVTPVTSLKAYP